MKGVMPPRIVVLRPPRARSDLTFGLGTECSIDSKPTKMIQRLRRVFLLEALALLGADPHTLRGVRLGIAWLCDGCCTSIQSMAKAANNPLQSHLCIRTFPTYWRGLAGTPVSTSLSGAEP